MLRRRPLPLCVVLVAVGLVSAAEIGRPPETRTEAIVERIHGVDVADPYRWLEDQQSLETRAWIDAQNAYTASVFEPLPGKDRIHKRLSELFKIDTVSTPFVRGGRYFFSKRAADQDLTVLYVRKAKGGPDEVLLDPHALSADHTMSVNFLDVTPDGKTLVYGVRDGGQDEVVVRVMDVDTRQLLADTLPKARYSGVSMTADKQALYYSRQTRDGPRVFVHKLGSDAADTKLFGDGYGPEKIIGCNISDDGRYLTVNVSHGSAAKKTELYYQDLESGAPLRPIVNDVEAVFGGPIGGDTLFLRTNWNAPNWRLLAVDLKDPARERWRELLPERKDAVLTGVATAGGRLFVTTLENVQAKLRVYEPSGKLVREVKLPELGSLGGVSGDFDKDEVFYSFSSLARPATIYRHEAGSGKAEEWARLRVPVASDSVEIKQVFYASKDGTRIPMFVAHKKGLALDGQRPALLTGYGGFNLSQNPGFSQRAAFWIENGGVYALPNLRGGGEFGEAWHRAGMLENKQNVFDDFIAAAEWLIANKYTSARRLAISGGSNGGLLVGAAMTQRPELFGAVVCSVPLLDMVRYHRFFVAGYWVPEYGSSEDPAQLAYIVKYSPYHNVKPGRQYPALLFISGDGDTRVAPLHARKMAALMQAAGSAKPALLRYDTKAGHSGGMPVNKTINDMTDEMRFLFWQTGVDAGVAAAPAAQDAGTNGRRLITETDLFRFQWIADPQISPDGSQVAFVRVDVDSKKEGYDTGIFLVSTSGGLSRRFTAGPRDSSPRWSPDGQWLAFLRTPAVEAGGRPQAAQIHLIAAAGGEAWAVTDLPRGAGALSWSPDGGKLLFSSTTTDTDLARKGEKPDPSKRESDVRVIARAVYRANGPGYLDPTRRSHLWTLEAPRNPGELGTPRSVTSGDFDEANAAWSPDGREIYFTSSRVKEPYYETQKAELFKVKAAGGEIVKVASMDGVIGDFGFSPDGRRIAFRGTLNGKPLRSYNQPDLFVVDNLVGATPRNLTAGYDFDIGAGLTGDQRAPRGGQPSEALWSRDGKTILVVAGENGRANLKRVDAAAGKVSPFTSGDQEVVAYTASADGQKLAVLVSTPTSVGDLFVADTSGKLTRLTDLNKDLFSELQLSEPEEIWYTSFDGKKAHSFVQKPPDFDPKKKYPLILNIHGGPHAAYGYTFDHEFQWMAAKGYVVVYPNPRGSTTYGQDFGNVIQYRYPGDDYKDLMYAVDEVIKRGYVDAAKLGVTGGSGGGVLTNWTITQTDRFAAAVSQRSIADWAGFWFTADFTLFQPTWFRGAPWEDPKDFASRSAITFVDKVETPLMLIEGETDMRTPPSDGGEQMFRALKYRKVPTVMVRFPGETHELSRSGRPWHRVERLQHIVGWFDVYLQGKQTDAYDVK